MASVRLRGVCAKVDGKKIIDKARQIRDILGGDYKIILEKNRICVEGEIPHDIRKKIDKILAS